MAVNDLTDAATFAHLLKYDSTHGRYPGEIEHADDRLIGDGMEITIYSERDPGKLPWGDASVGFVVESTGFFTERDAAAKQLQGGAKRVIISASGEGNLRTIVVGIK